MNTTIPPDKQRTAMLLSIAAMLAAQIPATIQSIPDTKVRAGMQIVILLVVIWLAWKAKPPGSSGPTIPKVSSLPDITPEPITVPDPPHRFNLVA